MNMPPTSTRLRYSPQVEQRLAELQLRLRIPMVGRRIREELFSAAERKQIEAESKTRAEAKRKRIEAEGKKLTKAEQAQIVADEIAGQDLVGRWSRIKNISSARAIADLGFAMDLLSPGQHARLRRDLGEVDVTGKPDWNREKCELRYDGKLVRATRGVKIAKNITLILDEFQRLNWPERIDNPLSDKDPQRLRETIAMLNTGLAEIVFRADGSGTGIIWELRTGRASTAHRP